MSDTAGSMREPDSGTTGKLDRLLLEAGLDDDGGLRPVLLELQSLAAGQPLPSDAVAALMVPAAAAAPAPSAPPADELAARRRAKRRVTLTTLSVAVSLAAGGAVAAVADQGVRDTFGQLNQAMTSLVAGTGAAPSEKPKQTSLTDPAQPERTASVQDPAAPVPSGPDAPPATEPASGASNGRTGVPAPAVPSSGIILPEDLAPGVPGAGDPLNTGPLGGVPGEADAATGQQPLLPLPGTPSASPAP